MIGNNKIAGSAREDDMVWVPFCVSFSLEAFRYVSCNVTRSPRALLWKLCGWVSILGQCRVQSPVVIEYGFVAFCVEGDNLNEKEETV